ncbi:MAG: MarR family transcriptional regulator [Hyphomicrobiales bacterium]|nr:MAG: MarR family transcriptional regulator [Hyphomicrobiales bacterium]
MNIAAPELAPLFRSDAQGELLARVLLNPEEQTTFADLARVTGISYATVHRELDRLQRMGLIEDERVGRARRVRARVESPAFMPLVELLLLTYGPPVVLPQILESVAGIEKAYIYGSWAARRLGEEGPPPGDIDVLAVGSASRSDLYSAAAAATRRLNREVSIRGVSPASWESAPDSFLRTVQERPLIELDLGDES